jgi:hypothetical protein
MVIYNLNIKYISGCPGKAHTPLFVDANAELACTVSPQRLQAVAPVARAENQESPQHSTESTCAQPLYGWHASGEGSALRTGLGCLYHENS